MHPLVWQGLCCRRVGRGWRHAVKIPGTIVISE